MGVLHNPPLFMVGRFQKTRFAQKNEEAANHRFNTIFYGHVDIQLACHCGGRSPTDRCVRCKTQPPGTMIGRGGAKTQPRGTSTGRGRAPRPRPQHHNLGDAGRRPSPQEGLGKAGRQDPDPSTITWETQGEGPAPRNKA